MTFFALRLETTNLATTGARWSPISERAFRGAHVKDWTTRLRTMRAMHNLLGEQVPPFESRFQSSRKS
jgi:hypothetical protein